MTGDIVQENVLPKKVESVFYHSFMSGLGNRMRAWVTTSAFAEYLNVPYIMKWRLDDACGQTPFEDLFEIPENMQYETGRRYQPDSNTLWIKKNYPNNNFHSRYIEGNYDLSQKEFQKIVDNQKRHIKPLPFIQERIDRYLNKYDFENSIGLHIRRTDLKEQEKTPDWWFDREIQKEIDENPNAKFFLATDNKWTEEKFMMKYPDHMFTTTCEYDDSEFGERYPGGDRKRHSPTSEGLADMLLLGSTLRVYGCHGSSFGRLGAWYGKKKFIIPDLKETMPDEEV
jgi:hypothetical protein